MFIKQIFYGVLRYVDFLKIFTENLFQMNKSSTERKDETLFQIFAYVTIFRLDELPVDDYKQLVYSQDYVKMNEFFKFLFNADILNNVLRPEWIKLYDLTYVDEKLIAGVLNHKDIFHDLLSSIMLKAQGSNCSTTDKTAESLKSRKVIVPEPFNLTQPKPKKVPEPIKLANNFISSPMPVEEYKKYSLKEIEEKRKKRLEQISNEVVKKYDKVKIEFETDKRPTNLHKIAEEVEKEIQKNLRFDQKYSIPLKDFTKVKADSKSNEAAILREEFLISKKKKQEEEELNKKLIEKKDSTEFERWRKECEERDNLLKMEEIQKRKLELEMNREIAQDYYNQRIIQNKLQVAKYKEEESQKFKEKEEKDIQELEEKRRLVKEMDLERENMTIELEKLKEKNKEAYTQQIMEYKEMKLKAQEEKRIEDERRRDIITQIRELEKLPTKRTTGFDPTETPGYGLLEEMSLVELKERLEIQKRAVEEYTIAKREENKLKMEERAENIDKKAKVISDYRDKLRNKNEINRQLKKENLAQQEQVRREIREKSLFEVKTKMENKKMKLKKEEEEFEKKIREIKLQRQFLQMRPAVVEEKGFKQIEDGMERKIKDQQNKKLFDQLQKEEVKWKEIQLRYKSAKDDVKEKTKLLNDYEHTFNDVRQINDVCLDEDLKYKSSLYDKQKKLEGIQRGKLADKNKYSDTLQQKMRETFLKTTIEYTKTNGLQMSVEY